MRTSSDNQLHGPRITVDVYGEDNVYKVSCCSGFYRYSQVERKAKEKLADHIQTVHGLRVDPSKLDVYYYDLNE